MTQKDLSNVDDVQIEALSDDELDAVSGGVAHDPEEEAPTNCCVSGSITIINGGGDSLEEG